MILEPSRGWRHLGIRELWAHRELLYFLVWRDVKVRYKQTIFGVAWALLQPILLVIVFSVSLGRLSGVGPPGISYPIFVLSGLVPWTLFSQSLSGASNSLVSGEGLITKVYFPRLLLPLANAASHLVDFAVTLGLLAFAMLASGVVPSTAVIWLPAFTVMAMAAALGVGSFLAAVNVRYRDVRYTVPFLVQLWFFATPIVYSSSLIPPEWRTVFALNPMSGVVAGFQWALLGGPPPGEAIIISVVLTAILFVGGLAYFRRAERSFADVV